jgi:hypothetical protein
MKKRVSILNFSKLSGLSKTVAGADGKQEGVR